MPDINSIEQQQILQQYSSTRLQETEEKDDKNQFLELMIAQLENQNPLDPQDGAEFLSQLAQFSTVDGIERLNDTMNGMADNYRSSQALQATALVGREVQLPSEIGYLDANGGISGSLQMTGSRSDIDVEIYSVQGELVRSISLGTQSGGDVPFTWDGMNSNGQRMPPGSYQVVAFANGGDEPEQLATNVTANVDSVTIDSFGSVTLNLNGLGQVPLDSVKQIN